MSNDIVSDMIKEMQLSPQKLQEISSQDPANNSMQGQMAMQQGQMQMQQGQMPMQMQQGQGQVHGGPEQQLQAMQLLQQQEQLKLQQQQYQQQMQQLQMQQMQQMQAPEQVPDDSTESTGSMMDVSQFGMEGGIVDQILSQLQNPLIVVVAFVIMSLPQVTTGLNGLLRAYVSPKGYLMLAIRAILSAGLFYLANFFLE